MKNIEDVLREEGILTLEEASRIYGISVSNLRNIIRGHLKSIQLQDNEKAHIGGIWLIRESALERYYQRIEGKVAYEPDLTGEKLKELMEKKGYTYHKLSSELNIPEWKIVKYESGKEEIPKDIKKKLLEILK